MNNTITLDGSVMVADNYKVHQFHKDQDIFKLLEAIKDDEGFSVVDNTVYFTGQKHADKGPVSPLQLKHFKPLGYPTVLTRYDRASVDLTDIYRGCTGFLVLSGPSTRELNMSLLEKPGLLKMCVNNSSRIIRPNLWTCVDPPDRFLYSVWSDPTIMKFVPDAFRNKSLWDTYEDIPVYDRKVGDCPNVFYYPRNTNFVPGSFLNEATINWGQSSGHSFVDPETGKRIVGTRSCMLVAMRILAMLGVRTVFLVGADFSMSPERPYAFDQGKSTGGAASNNNAYRKLNSFFNVLKPHFKSIGMQVFNTNPNSGLQSFPHMPFEEAVEFALKDVGDPEKEKTAGMYDKLSDKKKRTHKKGKKRNEIRQGLWDPFHNILIPPEDLKDVEKYAEEEPETAVESEPAETPKETIPSKAAARAEVMRYDHVRLLEDREFWINIYPDLKSVADECVAHIEEGAGRRRRRRGCTSCEKKRRAKPFSKAVYIAIQADPDKIKNHREYRPSIMIKGNTSYNRLDAIVAGAPFGD